MQIDIFIEFSVHKKKTGITIKNVRKTVKTHTLRQIETEEKERKFK
jgi:hypothetical protein